jgi:hypothetical protein
MECYFSELWQIKTILFLQFYLGCPVCPRTISTQKFKLLGEVSGYDLYYSLTHPLKWKPFGLETCTCPLYLVLNFYQINEDDEIRTRDRLVIKALIPCQRTISTQKLKLLGEVPKYDLYYSLTLYFLCIFILMWCFL